MPDTIHVENMLDQQDTDSTTQESSEESQQQEQKTTTQEPTPTPQPTSVDTSQVTAFYQRLLGDHQNRLVELQDRLDRYEKAPKEPEIRQVPADEWLTNPAEHTTNVVRDVVRHELASTIKPLNDFATQLQTQNQYASVKAKFSTVPQYKEMIDKYGAYIDQAMTGTAPTDQAFYNALVFVSGAINMGLVPQAGNTSTNTNANQPIKQATISSSPPAAPRGKSDDKPWENMTEKQRKAARAMGMNNQTYYYYLTEENPNIESWNPPQPEKK
jgi:hypothetical protein